MPEMDQELICDFVVEANEHLQEVERSLLALEAEDGESHLASVNEIFRCVHSMKGVSAFLGLNGITQLAHHLETVLNHLRQASNSPAAAVVAQLFEPLDLLKQMINNLGDTHEGRLQAQVQALCQLTAALQGEPSSTSSDSQSPGPVVPLHPVAQEPSEAITKTAGADPTIRISVALLDRLMNLTGELVLVRNQVLQMVAGKSLDMLARIAGKLDQVTGDLQETVMHGRMQPVGIVLNRMPRLVRDLSQRLAKDCRLVMEGVEVELDRTILEKLCDPLTHLVRNCVDHGLESTADRVFAGKPAHGTLTLHAFHQSGRVHITIADDGRGIDARQIRSKAVAKGLIRDDQARAMSDSEAIMLIFCPGFSTAEAVTEVSGRGVGMDVVRTNIESLGGSVEITSAVGRGTTVHLTLPLTLAIIPSLLVTAGDERYAIAESSILELVRLTGDEIEQRVEKLNGEEALRIRGMLLPIVHLRNALNSPPQQGNSHRRQKAEVKPTFVHASKARPLNIVVVEGGKHRYGIAVDDLIGPEQIVVKPLGEHLRDCRCLAGATILGDGRVAFIVDVLGLAAHADLQGIFEQSTVESVLSRDVDERQTVLLVANDQQQLFAVPMALVVRIERIEASCIEQSHNQLLMQYRGQPLPLYRLPASSGPGLQTSIYVLVFVADGHEVGLLVSRIADICEAGVAISPVAAGGAISGTFVLNNQIVAMFDLYELVSATRPPVAPRELETGTVLIAEDSPYFRTQLIRFLESLGHRVIACADGQEAWETLQVQHASVDLVLTDVEMPKMTGFEFCRHIKSHPTMAQLPVIALTSVSDPKSLAEAQAVGVTDYQLKMDKHQLQASVQRLIAHSFRNKSMQIRK